MVSCFHAFMDRFFVALFSSICFFSLTMPRPVTGSWWFLSQMQMSALGSGGSKHIVCDLVPGLTPRQRRLCQENPDVMEAINVGAKLAVHECQNQFRTQRWNCTTVERPGVGKMMLKLGSREAAFVFAISSAGVVHSIARACGKGELLDCVCDQSRQGEARDKQGVFSWISIFIQTTQPTGGIAKKVPEGDFSGGCRPHWGGCSDNLNYASSFARRFVDAKERTSRDGRSLMNLHNNRAGRRAVRRNLVKMCKCHGISGSCTTRTCWHALGNFQEVGQLLNERYQHALQVTINSDGAVLVPTEMHKMQRDSVIVSRNGGGSRFRSASTKLLKRIQRSDLVFFEPSPDYCAPDPKTGSVGTAGRPCNRSSTGADSCDVLCCGRGYNTAKVQRTYKCDCKFIWCCKVQCSECTETVDVFTCKDNNRTNAAATSVHQTFRFRHKRLPPDS